MSERERDRDLADDERVAHGEAAHRTAVGVLVLDRLDDRRTRRLQRGQEAEQHAGDRRRGNGEGEHAPIERDVERDRDRERQIGVQHGAERGARHDYAGYATGGGKQQRLDQELTHERAAFCADRETNRHLFATVARLREEEAREIRARDEQHESDDDHQRRRGGHDDGIEQRIDGDLALRHHDERRAGRPVRRVFLRHVLREPLGHGLRLDYRRARRETRLDERRMIPALLELVAHVRLQLVDHLDRHEHRRRDAVHHSRVRRGRHADDRVVPPRQVYRASDGGWIARKRALPVVVREDDDGVRARRHVVLRSQQTPRGGT